MWAFTVDSRDGYNSGDICNSCCCKEIAARPGESNKVLIDYTPWVLPLRGRGLAVRTSIDFTAPVGENVVQISMTTPVNQAVIVGVPTGSTEIPMYAPQHGTYNFATDTYTPDPGYQGTDTFFFKDSEGVVGEVVIGVGVAAPEFQKPIDIPTKKARIDQRTNTLTFPIIVSPAALPGMIYKITVSQYALDCDLCETYNHISCYDVRIGKCGW